MSDSNSPDSPTGFKEWARVCGLLADGSTSLILRKGGIAEGRGGFDFGHTDFWLFPTFFHNENEGLKPAFRREGGEGAHPEDDRTEVTVGARVEIVHAALLTDWEAVARLAPFHVWDESVIRERFDYKGAGLKAAIVRTYKLPSPFTFPYEKGKHGGCRSWVELPGDLEVLHGMAEPVLSDEDHAARVGEIQSLIEG